MTIKGIPILDVLPYALAAIGMACALLSRWGKLPPNVRRWLKAIGEGQVLAKIQTAAIDISQSSNEQKRAWVVAEVKALALKETGLPMPDSVANLIVENAYQAYKRAAKAAADKAGQ